MHPCHGKKELISPTESAAISAVGEAQRGDHGQRRHTFLGYVHVIGLASVLAGEKKLNAALSVQPSMMYRHALASWLVAAESYVVAYHRKHSGIVEMGKVCL